MAVKHLNEQEGLVARDPVLGGVWVLLGVGWREKRGKIHVIHI